MTNHLATLLARAVDADGNQVHDLLVPCTCLELCQSFAPDEDKHPPYPDASTDALLLACQKQGWHVHFNREGEAEITQFGGPFFDGIAPDNNSALQAAMVQATVPLAANWGKCGGDVASDETEESTGCQGWGYITGRNTAVGCRFCGGSGNDDNGTMIAGSGFVIMESQVPAEGA